MSVTRHFIPLSQRCYQRVDVSVYVKVPRRPRSSVPATFVEGIQVMMVCLPSSKQLLGVTYAPGTAVGTQRTSSEWEIDPEHSSSGNFNHCCRV